jgi:alkanesulfonate monooxygenase SsuD/methylene tetrahydromethanopterin reductase-like flavin-dependent oxidoreductase (luciferase family)
VSVGIGIALPTRELAMLGANDAGPLIKLARRVEELGFDSVWVSDSFVARQRLEPLTQLAAISMVTDRVIIGTAALIAVLREPLALAHIIVTLDQLSGGRLKLAIGTGLPLPVQAEYDAVTMPYRERVERVDEAVSAWKTVWQKKDGDLRGRYANLSRLRLQNPPLQHGGPDLWLASNGKPTGVARTGTLYDGWLPICIDPEQYRHSLHDIRETAKRAGRDPDRISPALFMNVNINSDAAAAEAGLNDYALRYAGLPVSAMRPYQIFWGGSDSDMVKFLREYIDAGARHIIMRIASFEDYERQLNAIAEDVVPAIHAIQLDE